MSYRTTMKFRGTPAPANVFFDDMSGDGAWAPPNWALTGVWTKSGGTLHQTDYNAKARYTGSISEDQLVEWVHTDGAGAVYAQELVLRSRDDTGSTGYKIYDFGRGANAVTAERDGSYLANFGTIAYSSGDTFRAQIVGGTLTLYVNDVSVATHTDGSPLVGGTPMIVRSGETTKPTIDDLLLDVAT